MKKPELVKEWHPTKNKNQTPNNISCRSNKKLWWICSKGHEWIAGLNNRYKGFGYPYCSGKKAHIENCFATINPELSKEWHPKKNILLTPYDVTSDSYRKIWRVCSKGHEWIAQVNHRSNGKGCPYCG